MIIPELIELVRGRAGATRAAGDGRYPLERITDGLTLRRGEGIRIVVMIEIDFIESEISFAIFRANPLVDLKFKHLL